MQKRTFYGFLGIVILVLALGSLLLLRVTTRQTALPATPPTDFFLTWSEGGGMSQSGSSITLDGKKGIVDVWDYAKMNDQRSSSEFTLSDQEFSELYAFLRSHAADTVGQDMSSQIFDGDNAGYELSWGDHNVHVWGMVVPQTDERRYTNIYTYLSQLFAKKISAQSQQ